MPVKRIRGKSALLAAIARLTAYLLTDHVAQNHQTLFRAPFFRIIQMVIHQFVEDTHGWVAL
ncbi:hypothetical protein D3C87_1724410 [compost metagenome]